MHMIRTTCAENISIFIQIHIYARPGRKWTLFSVHGVGMGDRVNDPSAGSPTETLLRLLLPLSDKVY